MNLSNKGKVKAVSAGSWSGVANDPVYVKTRCFETFPFPAEDTGISPALAERASTWPKSSTYTAKPNKPGPPLCPNKSRPSPKCSGPHPQHSTWKPLPPSLKVEARGVSGCP